MTLHPTFFQEIELELLDREGVSLDHVFDAYGLKKAQYRARMRELGMYFAIRTSPCKRAGHTLRRRTGHCAVCRTDGLTYLRRYYEPGEFYLAHSPRNGLVKVGFGKDAKSRVRKLNHIRYAGCGDWQIDISYECEDAAQREAYLQHLLAEYRAEGLTYNQGDEVIEANEAFDCGLEYARAAFKSW